MLERKIYSKWAYSDNSEDKSRINKLIYKEELEPKSKQFYDCQPTDEELKILTCYQKVGYGYGNTKYKILSNPFNLTELELALICDAGNLCFGYRKESNYIVIYID